MRGWGDGPPPKRTPSGGGGWGLPKFVSAYLLKEAAGQRTHLGGDVGGGLMFPDATQEAGEHGHGAAAVHLGEGAAQGEALRCLNICAAAEGRLGGPKRTLRRVPKTPRSE